MNCELKCNPNNSFLLKMILVKVFITATEMKLRHDWTTYLGGRKLGYYFFLN